MKERNSPFFISVIIILLAFLFAIGESLAKTDLSITVSDITFSKAEPLEGETILVFARVFNLGGTDVYGFVIFSKNGKEMADPQPISVKVNTYDDVFISWFSESGSHNIQAKVIGTNPGDENQVNDVATQENYFVDLDTDGDKIGNTKDLDDDNDGLSDEKETTLGTNPLNPDTDGDKARDNIDPFPLDLNERQDTDKDGIGDNRDTDDDNDGLNDEEELFVLGTNPLNPDSDRDGLSDKIELDLGTDPLKEDSDGDGIIDAGDDFPLDSTKFQASILKIAKKFIEDKGLSQTQILVVSGLVLMIVLRLFFFRKRKGKIRQD